MKQKKIIWLFVLSCFLIPFYFILHNYLDFAGLVNFNKLSTDILVWLTMPAVLLFFYWITTRNLAISTLATSILLILYFFAAPVLKELKNIPVLDWLLSYKVVIPLLVFFLLWFHFQLYSKKKSYQKTQIYICITFLVFLAVDVIQAVAVNGNGKPSENVIETNNQVTLTTPSSTTLKPDIFLFIFDEYPSSNSLQEVFRFNNSALDSTLTSLDFKVSPDARSAHFNTTACIYSVLGLAEISPKKEPEFSFKEQLAVTQELGKIELIPFFEKNGYTFINASMFDFHNNPSVVRNNIQWSAPEDMIKNQTFFRRVKTDIGWNFIKYYKKQFIKELNENVISEVNYSKKIVQTVDSSLALDENQPKFFYGHFFLPHYSYKFDENGNTIIWNYESYKKHFYSEATYLGQVKYANKLMIELITKIRSNNKRPSIIIIQGDHGNRNFVTNRFPNDHKKKILSAVYFPDHQYDQVPDDFFAPNTFRVVLNKYFDQQIHLLK